ncbi:clostripain-related cysteine peptidase [Myxococcus sp. RHSTA-1-4]|uniref:clostripain-related cysteine peptidase n=1 Tax=Myxococcus sp. RHSTA-1-4 TaxID=2874601 RepID=UPI001CBB8D1D|nr:clostripain-related cysteine peptidase [Myxococcus sp. RHSTA-1-4]MBZ4416408.1 hypothetical protein [Myxococcus sp. RHSTA-1-4]
MSWKELRHVAAALAVCALAACGDTEEESRGSHQPPSTDAGTIPGTDAGTNPPPREHPASGESWTVLVYMVADNDLEPFALQDLEEMMQVGSGRSLTIVAQIDRAVGYSSSSIGSLPDFTTTKRLRVVPGGVEALSDLGEVNMGVQQTLSDFIAWGVRSYPADRYALVFWDHGGAWPGFGGDNSTPGHDLLSIAELKAGIDSGMKAAGLGQFALIGYDACLMATYEVALAMRPYGEYLLASEELEPGHGWDWRSLQVLKDDPRASPHVLGQRIIQGFLAQAVEQRTSSKVTLSLTDLYALNDLVGAVGRLADAYTPGNPALATSFGRALHATLSFGASPDPSQSTHMVDLGDLADQLAAQVPTLAPTRDTIKAALLKAVVARSNGGATQRATGLSIYFPALPHYYNSSYAALSEVAAWRGFLARYYEGAQGTHPTFLSETATLQQGQEGMVLRGYLTSGSAEFITRSELYYGIALSDGRLVALGDRPALVNSGTAPYVEGSWNTTALVLTQGAQRGYGYLSLVPTDDGHLSVIIPFAYREAAGASAQYALRMILINGSGSVMQDIFYVESEGGFGQLSPVDGARLIPLVQVFSTAGSSFASGGAEFDATLAIGLTFERLPSGTSLFGILSVADYTGEGDTAYNVGVQP